MNQDETIALFLQGKEAWNAWAESMLAEREAMEADGRWSAEHNPGDLEPQNDATRDWMARARADFSALSIATPALLDAERSKGGDKVTAVLDPALVKSIVVESGDTIDFSGWIFPWRTDFREAQFHRIVWFGEAQFHGEAGFREAQFRRNAWFGKAQFHHDAWFGEAQFRGRASFEKAQFHRDAGFNMAQFHGYAGFGEAQFHSEAGFGEAQFRGHAGFGRAQFHSGAIFWEAQFHRDAGFNMAQFHGAAGFGEVQFHGEAAFGRAQFHDEAAFGEAQFDGYAGFGEVQFHRAAGFADAQFHDEAWFGEAQFHGYAGFGEAQFHGRAGFAQTDFNANVTFADAYFDQEADFGLVQFLMFSTFPRVRFHGPANFNAIRGERAFDLANARFALVPDFIQAHFEEAPRLDNVRVAPRMLDTPAADSPLWRRCKSYPGRWLAGAWRRCSGGVAEESELRDIPARWRALKRLAVQAHDQDREHDFFAREIRAARFVTDWPWPRPFWESRGWLGWFSFIFGGLYGLASNYGRSVLLPFLWWLAGVAVAATFYFGEHREITRSYDALAKTTARQRMLSRPWGELPYRAPEKSLLRGLFWSSQPSPCYTPQPLAGEIKPGEVGVIGLSQQVRDQTTAIREALQLAMRDGFLILYGDADTAHRTYGCLYGIELYSNSTPVAIVPPQIGLFSAFHKLYSAIMIFLFGLALRNMLKMK